jgi:hypothetical protein
VVVVLEAAKAFDVTSIVVVVTATAKMAMIDNVLAFMYIVASDSGYAIYEVGLSLV